MGASIFLMMDFQNLVYDDCDIYDCGFVGCPNSTVLHFGAYSINSDMKSAGMGKIRVPACDFVLRINTGSFFSNTMTLLMDSVAFLKSMSDGSNANASSRRIPM